MLLAKSAYKCRVLATGAAKSVVLTHFSTDTTGSYRHSIKNADEHREEFGENEFGLHQVQKGTYSHSLTLLKRVSVASAVISVTALPYMLLVSDTTKLAQVGKYVIIATGISLALGSTLFLKTMSYPYVTRLFIAKDNDDPDEVILRAERLNFYGGLYSTDFKIKSIESVTVMQHPFASFQVNKDCFFVYDLSIRDERIREAILRKSKKGDDELTKK